MTNFGQRIRALREARGWTHRQLAERTGGAVSSAAVGHLETGRRAHGRLDTAQAIAAALGLPLGDLLNGELEGLIAVARAARTAEAGR